MDIFLNTPILICMYKPDSHHKDLICASIFEDFVARSRYLRQG